jgi:choline-sulfatase
MSDEHNPFYSEPHGHSFVKTPNMQELAHRGVVFENGYCPSPLCMPSRSAFTAGRRVHQIQTYSNCNILLDPSPMSYGAALANQGVHSAYIGKTDLYAPGKELGFSEMILPGDRELPGDTNHRRNPVPVRAGAGKRANGYGQDSKACKGDILCVDRAVQWLQEDADRPDAPWVLIVNILAPHYPHIAPPEFWNMYPQDGDLPEHGQECESGRHPYAQALKKHFETHVFAEQHIRGLRKGYYACVSFVDHQLGRLMDALEIAGLADTTNVVYTSDHGEMLGKFGMWWKSSLYEDAVRIPMIAAGPDFARGARVKTPVDLHDLQASLFASTNAVQPSEFLGTPLQRVPHDDPDRAVFSEYHGHGAPGSSYMIRKGRWKYLHYTGAPCQLFDLESDPNELKNLADTRTEKVAELEAELNAICSPSLQNDRAEQLIKRQLEHVALM